MNMRITAKLSCFLVALVLVSSVIVGCSKSAATPSTTTTKPSATPAATSTATKTATATSTTSTTSLPAKELIVGASFDLSGPVSPTGIMCRNAAQMAVDEINMAGGIDVAGQKYLLKLSIQDDGYTSTGGIGNATKIAAAGIKYMLFMGAPGEAAASVTEPAKMITFHTSSTDTVLKGKSYTFRIYPIGYTNFVAALDYFKGARPNAKKVYIAAVDDASGRAVVDTGPKIAAYYGLEVVGAETYATSTTDFSPLLTRVLPKNPDIIWVAPDAAGGLLIKQAVDKGYKGIFVTRTSASKTWVDALGKERSGDEKLFMPLVSLDSSYVPPRIKAFSGSYVSLFKSTPDVFPSVIYNYVYLIAEAVKKAGTVNDTDKIKATLETGTFDLPWDTKTKFGGTEIYGVPHDAGFPVYISTFNASTDSFVLKSSMNAATAFQRYVDIMKQK